MEGLSEPAGGDVDIGSPELEDCGLPVMDPEFSEGRPETESGRLRVAEVIEEGGELVGENMPWASSTVSGGVA